MEQPVKEVINVIAEDAKNGEWGVEYGIGIVGGLLVDVAATTVTASWTDRVARERSKNGRRREKGPVHEFGSL